MHSESAEERRRYPRSRRSVQIIRDESDSGLLNHVDNISVSGVLCHTIKPLALMTKIGMALELPKPVSQRVDAEGVVVRCEADELGDDHFRVAILFTKISDENQAAIQRFVESDIEIKDDAND